MPAQENPDHRVKRVVLPSGKTIEVVYFESAEEQNATAHAASVVERTRDLHVCEDCSSDLMYPVDWEEAGPEHWNVTLRCPECEGTSGGVYHQDVVDMLDERLDNGTDVLVRDLKQLISANMAEELERFRKALEADAILPEDF